jgi:hypothetical protein
VFGKVHYKQLLFEKPTGDKIHKMPTALKNISTKLTLFFNKNIAGIRFENYNQSPSWRGIRKAACPEINFNEPSTGQRAWVTKNCLSYKRAYT